MDKTSLGDRMKNYETVPRNYLIRRTPVIIRLDGKAFHTLTRKMDKPYDKDFRDIMMSVTEYLVDNVMGCRLGYVQSDEISLLLTDYNKLETEAWFNNNVQKMVSISASMATAKFNELYRSFPIDKKRHDSEFGLFDSRAYNLPREEVVNYFIWRQQDATRNSIQGLGQAEFGHKEMHGKNTSQVQDMLMLDKGINWNDVETYFKRGGVVYRGYKYDEPMSEANNGSGVIVDNNIPIFTKDREYIDVHVFGTEDNREELTRQYMNAVHKRINREAASEILEGIDDEVFSASLDIANDLLEENEDE